MSIYEAKRRSAAAAIKAKGAAVAFEFDAPGTYDDATGREAAPATSRADGYAVDITGGSREQGTADRIAQLIAGGVALVDPVELLVAAEGLAFEPKGNQRMLWAGKTYIVKESRPLAPDGTAITYTVIGSRG